MCSIKLVSSTMAIIIKTKSGDITIENDVIATIVGGSAIENPGVVGMASKATFRDGMNQILNRENYAKGVVVRQKENQPHDWCLWHLGVPHVQPRHP